MDQSRRLIHGEVQPGYKLGLGDSPSFISALLRYTAGLEVAPLGLSEVVSEPRLRRSPAAEAVFRSRSSHGFSAITTSAASDCTAPVRML